MYVSSGKDPSKTVDLSLWMVSEMRRFDRPTDCLEQEEMFLETSLSFWALGKVIEIAVLCGNNVLAVVKS